MSEQMKINAKDFKNALDHVQAAVPKRGTMPIVMNALFQSLDDSRVKITTNDMKQQISYTVECENSGGIFSTVEFEKLFKLVSKYKDDQTVKLSFTDESALVTCAKSKGKLKVLPAGEFPLQSTDSSELKNVSFNGSELVEAVKNAASMAAQNDVRYYLNGVALDIKKEYTNVVATDGHRLIKIKLNCENESELERLIIIPNEAVSGFIKSMDEQPVSMNIASTFVQFSDDVVEFQSQLLDGKYPDYNRVIPQNNNLEFNFIGKELKDAISRVAIFGDGKNTPLRIAIDGSECVVTVAGNDNTQGDEIVNCSSTDSIEIGVNAQYLTETVSKIESDNIAIFMKDANTAMFIPDGDTEIVVMPMRI